VICISILVTCIRRCIKGLSDLAFEQGLVDKNGTSANLISESRWSWIPKTQPLINGFSNEPNTRQFQDVGLDGVSNENEREKFKLFLERVKLI
jgi:cell surface protein SprA